MEIVVLYGGESSERTVSLCSGERVSIALRERGHRVSLLDYRQDPLGAEWLARMRGVDAVYLALHGGAGEDGSLQSELEQNGIFHYTGSDAVGSALAMQKDRAKVTVSAMGVPVAKGCILRPGEPMQELPEPPLVVKPLAGGSSVGLSFFESKQALRALRLSEPMLCEPFLPGREYTVGVLGERVLPAVEICPIGGRYDYEHKYTPGATQELCPAPITSERSTKLADLALVCFATLGLRDLARIDFKEDAAGEICFLEANACPGMTPTSLLPLAAKTAGISFGQLCEQIAMLAAARKRI